eukprot:SAG11_NODE_1650_length_4510_cov_6.795738_2_plen_61_part_00
MLYVWPAKIQHKAHAEFEENPLSNQSATQTPIRPGLKDFLKHSGGRLQWQMRVVGGLRTF